MPSLPSRTSKPRAPKSCFALLLLPLSVAISPSCKAGGINGSDANCNGSCCLDGCSEEATGSFPGTGGTAPGTGGAGGNPPMDVCPAGSLSPDGPCTPTDPGCNTLSLCMAPIDQSSAKVFGLRMAQLDVSRPASFSQGAAQQLVASSILPDDAACNLAGTGTFSWLLQFDAGAGTLTTGGARPVSDPSAGYAFDDETITAGSASFHVAKVVLDAGETPECAFSSSAADLLVVPVFTDATGANVMLLPLHQLSFDSGRISADNGCIGRFDAGGLAENGCQPDLDHHAFLDDASVSAFFDLEEADTVDVPVLGASLCVLLAGDATDFGDGATPVAHCRRDAAGKILFQGDWCSSTDAKATPACSDALRFSAQFAAVGATVL